MTVEELALNELTMALARLPPGESGAREHILTALKLLAPHGRVCGCGKPAILWSAGSGLCGDCNVKRNERSDRRLGFSDDR